SVAAEMLASYSWPGNLRELANVVKRAVLLARDAYITPTELSQAMGPQHQEPVLALHDESAERQRILSALQQTAGNKSKAARLLGIDRKTLYNKLERLGI
uniref:helix-turn-helix domain-containing protein n=1 Tax=Prevotella sp. TaxID=59823 RepID=UPI003FED4BF2